MKNLLPLLPFLTICLLSATCAEQKAGKGKNGLASDSTTVDSLGTEVVAVVDPKDSTEDTLGFPKPLTKVDGSLVPLDTIRFQDKRYMVFTVDPKKHVIEIFNRRMDRRGAVHDFGTIHFRKEENKDQTLLFAMNAGMFQRNYLPTGLLVQDGKTVSPIDKKKEGYGNFYMQPNGFFAMDEKQNPAIFLTSDYDKVADKLHLATQSGPMMVFQRKFNPNFNEGSPNLHIRNGVGINKKGEVIFAISMVKVNFYEFSQLFRDVLDCDYALYLDGFVSQAYVPAYQDIPRQGPKLGPIVAVSMRNEDKPKAGKKK